MAVDIKYLHSDITHHILQAFYTVCRRLPFGLTVPVYKKALTLEFKKLGLQTELDKELSIKYDQSIIGSLLADFVVNGNVLVKIISQENITASTEMEVKNQLKLSDYEVCLILNFGIEGQHKRLVYTNDLKNN